MPKNETEKAGKRKRSGRRPLGDNKRKTDIMVRLNTEEKKALYDLAKRYNIDIDKRGQQGPFVRKLLLQNIVSSGEKNAPIKRGEPRKGLPDATEIIAYEIHKIGVNINQLTRRIHQKNKNPMSKDNQDLVGELGKKLDAVHQKLNTLNPK